MRRRKLLVALLVASTAVFVVGVSIERSSGDTHTEPAAESQGGESGEGGAEHAAEGDRPAADEGTSESFFGLDYEAAPFVALAAAFTLVLAAAVWLRPRWALLLGAVAVTMVAFAALDVREVVHQLDESKGGLAVLAALVAGCHVSAAAVAALMGRSASPAGGSSLA